MDKHAILEAVGYFATVLVLISFLMTSVVKLRLINLIGSANFTVYAILIGSIPTALLNFGICAINVYFLVRLLRSEKRTTLVLTEPDGAFLQAFLARYGEDIRKFFPDYAPDKPADAIYFVCDELTPRGLLMGSRQKDGALLIDVDYAIPAYRDNSIGKFLYPRLLEQYSALEFSKVSRKHKKYLLKMGFTKQGGRFRLDQAES